MIIYCQLYWKEENIEKEAENGPFEKSVNFGVSLLPNLRSASFD